MAFGSSRFRVTKKLLQHEEVPILEVTQSVPEKDMNGFNSFCEYKKYVFDTLAYHIFK